MINIHSQNNKGKLILGVVAIVIIAISLIYTQVLASRIKLEEEKKVELYLLALQSLSYTAGEQGERFDLQGAILEDNTTIPILVVSDDGSIIGRNFGEKKDTDRDFLEKELQKLQESGKTPITIESPFGKQYAYYKYSKLLILLNYYPLIMGILVASFILAGYVIFSSSRRAEQNRVWVGMAKETAHQLGTPISGIVAWIEHLKLIRNEDEEVAEILTELRNDVGRLELIADRFSKIGSPPELTTTAIYGIVAANFKYMQRRSPRRVKFELPEEVDYKVLLNKHLFDWVLENLLRNALDAMGNKGTISADFSEDNDYVYVFISDTGKGIPESKQKTIFKPGFTTKKRGWGLGLSLTKRIVENYHSGKIFVQKSIINEGSTFCIQLPRL